MNRELAWRKSVPLLIVVSLLIAGGCTWYKPWSWSSGEPVDPAIRDYESAKKAYDDGDYDESLKLFQRFVIEHPDSTLAQFAQFYLAQSYREQALWDNASQVFAKFLEGKPFEPMIPVAWYDLGGCYEKLGRIEDARRAYNMAIATSKGTELGDWARFAEDRLAKLP